MKKLEKRTFLGSKVLLLSFQTKDPYFVGLPDLHVATISSMLVTHAGLAIHDLTVRYIYPFSSSLESLIDSTSFSDYDFLLIGLENTYHSSEYCLNFATKLFEYLEHHNSSPAVIIHTMKTPEPVLFGMMEKFSLISAIVTTDFEYFLHEVLVTGRGVSDLPDVMSRDDAGCIRFEKIPRFDTDPFSYMQPAYASGVFTRFPKSIDEIVRLRRLEGECAVDESIPSRWSDSKYASFVRSLPPTTAMLSTGRGCRFSCAYCYRGSKYATIRQFPLDLVGKDLQCLSDLGYERIYFYDDCFVTTNLDRLDAFLELLRRYRFTSKISARYEALTPEILLKLSEMLVADVQIGIQSISLVSNEKTGRRFDPAVFRGVIDRLKAIGMRFSFDIILGLPYENLADFLRTFNFALEMSPTQIFINTLFINPMTQLHDKRQEYGIITDEDLGITKDFHVPKMIRCDSFGEKDLAVAAKYIRSAIARFPEIEIIFR